MSQSIICEVDYSLIYSFFFSVSLVFVYYIVLENNRFYTTRRAVVDVSSGCVHEWA